MRLKAKDSFYSSETRQIDAGAEFEVESEARAREFVARGLAEVISEEDEMKQPAETKKQAPPLNKAAPKPENKAAPKAEAK